MAIPADKVVLTSAIVTLGSTTAASLLPKDIGGQGSLPAPKLLFGTALTFMGLSFTADFAPQVAKPLAAAIAITALTYYGMPVMDNWFNGKHNAVGRPTTKGKK
jgi:hypothetical protein